MPRVKDLCQQVGDSLRDAVDTLRRYWEAGEGTLPQSAETSQVSGDKAAMGWRCLVRRKDYRGPLS